MKKVDFPKMSGLMATLYNYILETSPVERPILTYASVITIMGTILSNLYRFNKSYPVFYAMMIARSGSGKNRPLKVAKDIFSSCELFDYIGLAGYRSDASIIDQLKKQRHRLDMLDEVDGVFKITKSENGFMSGIINITTELWSDCSGYYSGRYTKSGGKFGDCWNPCININSALTPTAFRENFTKSMMQTGFGGRFMYFIGEDDVAFKDDFLTKSQIEIPEEVIIHFKKWHGLKELNYCEDKDRYEAINLQIDLQAKKRLEDLRKKLFHYGITIGESDPMSPVVQRTYEYIERLLIIHTVSENPENRNPVIRIQNVEWCYQLMIALHYSNERFLSQNISEGKFDLLKGKILRYVKEAGSKGIRHSVLLKNSHLKAKELREVVGTLKESEQITEVEAEGSKFYFYMGME